jgi:hypothetical protein
MRNCRNQTIDAKGEAQGQKTIVSLSPMASNLNRQATGPIHLVDVAFAVSAAVSRIRSKALRSNSLPARKTIEIAEVLWISMGGSASSMTRSATLPWAMDPYRSLEPINSDGLSVAACNAASGGNPEVTIRASSSWRLKPGKPKEFPASVPASRGTPAR